MRIDVRGEPFELLPERGLFWPSQRTLVLADCHLGKAETFQQQGLWLPSQSGQADLMRLSMLAKRWDPRRILFLGDLIHARSGVTPDIVARFADWIDEFGGAVSVVLGNHDTGLAKHWPPEWHGAQLCDRAEIGSFVFQHLPQKEPVGETMFHWVGHVHPTILLAKGPDRMRLPGFVIGKSQGLLPAFSSASGGCDRPVRAGERAFVIGEGRVFEV
jgi:DNA ligase-associated metallophosphoesterase